MKEKKIYEPAEIRIVLLDRDMLELSANGTLGESEWEEFDFNSLPHL